MYYLLARHPGRALVFVNAVSALRRVAAVLKLLGLPAQALHAQQQQRQRLKALDRFKANADGVLVATDVAARGLDVKGVQTVVHYQIPASADTYIHRCGRTARTGGADGLAVSLVAPNEAARWAALLRALGRLEAPPARFPVERALLKASMARVALAVKVDEIERRHRKARAEASWARANADAAGVALSDDDLADLRDSDDDGGAGGGNGERGGGKKGAKKKRKAAAAAAAMDEREAARLAQLRAQLAAALAEPLQARVSSKYFTGGASSLAPAAAAAAAAAAAKAAAPAAGADGGDGAAPAAAHAVLPAEAVAQTVALAARLHSSRRGDDAGGSEQRARVAGGAAGGGVQKKQQQKKKAGKGPDLSKLLMSNNERKRLKRAGGGGIVVVGGGGGGRGGGGAGAFGRDTQGATALAVLRAQGK